MLEEFSVFNIHPEKTLALQAPIRTFAKEALSGDGGVGIGLQCALD
jgi:hypothetical protein